MVSSMLSSRSMRVWIQGLLIVSAIIAPCAAHQGVDPTVLLTSALTQRFDVNYNIDALSYSVSEQEYSAVLADIKRSIDSAVDGGNEVPCVFALTGGPQEIDAQATVAGVSISGMVLGAVHGDPKPGVGGLPIMVFTLLQDSGAIVDFRLTHLAPFNLGWERVRLIGSWIVPDRIFEARQVEPLPAEDVSITGRVTGVPQRSLIPGVDSVPVATFKLLQDSGISVDFRLAPSTPFNFEWKCVRITGRWIRPGGRVLLEVRHVVPIP